MVYVYQCYLCHEQSQIKNNIKNKEKIYITLFLIGFLWIEQTNK